DGVVNAADLQTFVAVLLQVDTDPQHVARSDFNGDGIPDGDDIQCFIGAYVGLPLIFCTGGGPLPCPAIPDLPNPLDNGLFDVGALPDIADANVVTDAVGGRFPMMPEDLLIR